jgi:transposase-like protein
LLRLELDISSHGISVWQPERRKWTWANNAKRIPRRTFSADDEVRILREHLVEKVPVSQLCDRYGLNPNVLYRWQKEFFEQGATAFERQDNSRARQFEAKIAALEAKLAAAREQRAARRRLVLRSEALLRRVAQVPDGHATDTNTFLTKENTQPTVPSAGETDAGTLSLSKGGEQLASDSRLGCGRKARAGLALRDCPRPPLEPFGPSPHASGSSRLPQASRTLTDAGRISISG